jgi:hypothetical protein
MNITIKRYRLWEGKNWIVHITKSPYHFYIVIYSKKKENNIGWFDENFNFHSCFFLKKNSVEHYKKSNVPEYVLKKAEHYNKIRKILP